MLRPVEVWLARGRANAGVVVRDRGRRGLVGALGGFDRGVTREVAVRLGGLLVGTLGAEACL